MARTKPSTQLSQVEIERFLTAAEALHKSIVKPLISPHCDHYRSTRTVLKFPVRIQRRAVRSRLHHFVPLHAQEVGCGAARLDGRLPPLHSQQAVIELGDKRRVGFFTCPEPRSRH